MTTLLPFDPETLIPPGSTNMPEPAAVGTQMNLRDALASIAATDPYTVIGARTTQYKITDYVMELDAGRRSLVTPAMREVADQLAASVKAVIGDFPISSRLKPNQPDAYWLIGQLYPDPANNPTPVNHATMAFMEKFFELLAGYGYTFVNSVAYEVLNFFMPDDWKQKNWLGNPALSGWYPPSCFVRPTSDDAINYLANVQIQVLEAARARGVPCKFQIGEPWWWDGSYSTGVDDKFAPCIYDPHTVEQYRIETGQDVPTPYIKNIFDEVPQSHWPFIEWLRDKLGHSTNAIRDIVKEYFRQGTGEEIDATLLFFTPQIMSPLSDLTKVMNFPTDHWKAPNYDFVQIEDYDWIIEGRLDLVPLTFDAAYEKLGYARDDVHYFVGFILNAWDYHIWTWIDTAIRMAKEANMLNIYVWSYTQAMRDSILYDDLPPSPMQVPIFDMPPNWSSGYKVSHEYRTEIITSRGGKEQRRALRRTPRKVVEFTTLLTGADMRKFDAFVATWQGFSFFMPEMTRKVATVTSLGPGQIGVKLASIPPWLQLGTIVILVKPGRMDARAVARIDGNLVEFMAGDAHGETWPEGTTVHPALHGELGQEIETRRLNDRVTEASITFNVNPGSEPPPWAPSVAPLVFDGVELFAKRPNWSGPVSTTLSKQLEKIDYGQGRTRTFLPTPFTQRLSKHTYLNRNGDEASSIEGFFTRMRGRQGVFWAPTWLADMEIDAATVPGNTLYLQGDDIPAFLTNDSVYRNVAIIDEVGNVTPFKIMAVTATSDGRTKMDVSPPLTQHVLDTAEKVSWLVLSRLGGDTLIESWVTDDIANVEFSIQSLQNTER